MGEIEALNAQIPAFENGKEMKRIKTELIELTGKFQDVKNELKEVEELREKEFKITRRCGLK